MVNVPELKRGVLDSVIDAIGNTPIVKLNVNISRLNTTIEMFQEDTEEKHDALNKRVTEHGKQIDELEKVSVNHEVRIKAIEKEK